MACSAKLDLHMQKPFEGLSWTKQDNDEHPQPSQGLNIADRLPLEAVDMTLEDIVAGHSKMGGCKSAIWSLLDTGHSGACNHNTGEL